MNNLSNLKNTPVNTKITIFSIRRFVAQYIVPIITLTIFFLIVILLVIPKFREIFSDVDKIAANNTIIRTKNIELEFLAQLKIRYPELVESLNIINKIAPAGVTQVLSFRDKITKLANANSLTITSQSFSEAQINSLGNQIYQSDNGGILLLQSIPSIFEIEGKYEEIINFINDLDTVDDFVVIKQMDFIVRDRNNPNASPRTEIRFDKYLFNDLGPDALRLNYINIPVTALPSPEFLKYISKRNITI